MVTVTLLMMRRRRNIRLGQKGKSSQNKLNIYQVVVWRTLTWEGMCKHEEIALNPVSSYVAQSLHHITVVVVVVVAVLRHLYRKECVKMRK